MQRLNFPIFAFKLKKENEVIFILDSIRRKYVKLTPEEWVRQHVVQFLITEKNVPKGRIGIEQQLKVNTMLKRTDIVVYDSIGKPLLIVECKSADIMVNQKIFEQVACYNLSLKSPFLLITNGLIHISALIDFKQQKWSFLESLPDYNQMIAYKQSQIQ